MSNQASIPETGGEVRPASSKFKPSLFQKGKRSSEYALDRQDQQKAFPSESKVTDPGKHLTPADQCLQEVATRDEPKRKLRTEKVIHGLTQKEINAWVERPRKYRSPRTLKNFERLTAEFWTSRRPCAKWLMRSW